MPVEIWHLMAIFNWENTRGQVWRSTHTHLGRIERDYRDGGVRAQGDLKARSEKVKIKTLRRRGARVDGRQRNGGRRRPGVNCAAAGSQTSSFTGSHVGDGPAAYWKSQTCKVTKAWPRISTAEGRRLRLGNSN